MSHALAPRAPLPTPPPFLALASLPDIEGDLVALGAAAAPPSRRCDDGLCALTTTTTLYWTPSPSTSTICSTITSSTWIENVWETAYSTSWSTLTLQATPVPVETRTSTVYTTRTSTSTTTGIPTARPCCETSSRRRREGERWDAARVNYERRWQGDDVVTSTATLVEQATTTAWYTPSSSWAPTPTPTWDAGQGTCDMSCYNNPSSSGEGGHGDGGDEAEQTQGSSASQCGCSVAWISLFFGGVPSKGGDFFA